MIYKTLKPLLFNLDAEKAHNMTMQALGFVAEHPGAERIAKTLFSTADSNLARLETEHFGHKFKNPLGLAAGFDKNAQVTPVWQSLGFGFVEIGSVTAVPQAGNDKPRLFRYPEQAAVINRMGFNNQGAEVVAERLKVQKSRLEIPLGINLGKSKVAELELAPQDYLKSLNLLWDLADYLVVNVSSPNTPGLRQLQDRGHLNELLSVVQDMLKGRKPLLLKIAPDMTWEQFDDVIALTEEHKIAGIIATNTTIDREVLGFDPNEAGGLSGEPLKAKSLKVLKYLQANCTLPIISVGGISTADDAYERLKAGASLLQIYTALVYQGPFLLKNINKGLLERMDEEGIANLAELQSS